MNTRVIERDKGARPGAARFLVRQATGLLAQRGISDTVIVVSGLALAIGCALFPWYVFFNQDKFGVQAMNFSGNKAESAMPEDLLLRGELVRRQLNPGEVPQLGLDLLSTGTLPGRNDPASQVPLGEQPFPGAANKPEFKLVHVANGRAMIEDADGLWVVQTGSTLPDASRVAAIEKRDGQWVLVTDAARVIPLSQ